MLLKRNGTQASTKGSADYFVGTVRVDPLHAPTEPSRFAAGNVTFEPGARTNWHTHPLGQLLIVTAGCGWAQVWDEPKQEVRAGDVIWFPAGQKHWHGAAATTSLTHVAVQEAVDGKVADWLEPVTEEQYLS